MPKLKKLSIKQKKYVNAVVRTGNRTQSVLEAYNTKSPNVAQNIATKLDHNPMVQEAIDLALAKNNITLDNRTARLVQIADWAPDKVSSDTVLKANIELIKLLKGYENIKQKIESRSIKVTLNSKEYKELIDLHKQKSTEVQEIIDSY